MGKIYERCFKKEVDKEAVAYYRDVIQTIKAHGMKPIVSLEHWDIPAILLEKYDGWASRETVDLYVDYVQKFLMNFMMKLICGLPLLSLIFLLIMDISKNMVSICA